MASTNGSHELQDVATRIGILSQRTTNLESTIQSINASIGAMSTKVDERFNAIAASIAERSRPQWQALSVVLAFAAVIGGLAYMPIRESTSDLKEAVKMLAEKSVTRDELDWRSARGTEDRKRTEDAITDLRSGSVTRNEWMERNGSRDHQLEAIEREINDLKMATSSVYNARDVILDMRSRLDRLEAERPRTRFP